MKQTKRLAIPDMTTVPKNVLLRRAELLALLTIAYNCLEGIVSIFFGMQDDTLALFGFGLDSIVEVISGAGIFHMIRRMRSTTVTTTDHFERQALRITGWSFFLLAVAMVSGAIMMTINHRRPETTMAGIIVSLLSIGSMWWLLREKMKAGKHSKKPDRAIPNAAVQATVTDTREKQSIRNAISGPSYGACAIPDRHQALSG